MTTRNTNRSLCGFARIEGVAQRLAQQFVVGAARQFGAVDEEARLLVAGQSGLGMGDKLGVRAAAVWAV